MWIETKRQRTVRNVTGSRSVNILGALMHGGTINLIHLFAANHTDSYQKK